LRGRRRRKKPSESPPSMVKAKCSFSNTVRSRLGLGSTLSLPDSLDGPYRSFIPERPDPFTADSRQKRKYEKWIAKHPHRPLPIPTAVAVTGAATPATNSGANKSTASNKKAETLSFMLLETGEEFGVRRPFDAPGLPRALGGPTGQAGWPMMSRTMTQVSHLGYMWGRCNGHAIE
jgi:hypothetical protein